MAISHAGHDHPSTPAARSACRKLMQVGQPYVEQPEGVSAAGYRALVLAKGEEYIKMTGATARKLARHAAAADRMRAARKPAEIPARIQPRRGGARVSAGASTCVQAALHTGTGRCACGWHADDHCKTEVWACTGH